MPAWNTIADALNWARKTLDDLEHTEPLDASVLLAHALDVDRGTLIAHPESALTTEQAARYEQLITQRAAGDPVAYLIHKRAFYGRDFYVDHRVLIPRPETEHLVETALTWLLQHPVARVVDVGTGSGAIVISLACARTDMQLWATDISSEALGVARINAHAHGVVGRIQFLKGDLLAPLGDAQLDLIVANLPYIPSRDVDELPVVEYEPRVALDGGADGLDLIRRLLNQARERLTVGGLMLLEIMSGQGGAVRGLALNAFPTAQVRVIHDYAGHERIVRIERAASGVR